jgi:outer membrane protein assembly factor BamB
MRRLVLSAVLPALLAAGPGLADTHWPQFRGSHGGVAEGVDLPTSWDTTKNVAWSTKVPGKAWSSPVVWGDKVFVTTAVSAGDEAVAKKGLYLEATLGKKSKAEHRWLVYCLDLASGKVLWEKTAHKGVPGEAVSSKNSYATETPVTDGRRVYAYFGNVGLFCYDLDGKELWSWKVKPRKTRYGWGPAASPVLHKDRVYVQDDNDEKSFLAALDAKTGREVWRVERAEKSNWATPFVWQNDQRTEIVTAGSRRVRSYDPGGKLLWELGGMSSIAIPTPVAGHGLLYVSSGYVNDRRRPIFAIRPGASGDISLKEGETSNKYVAWFQKQAGPYDPSPVVYGDYLYVLHDRGFLGCYDAKTGKEAYKERIPGADAFTASPWAWGGKVFCLSEDGDTIVVEAGPKFKVLGKNRLDEMCLATPAVVRDGLIIRTASKVYRIARP